MKRRIFAMAVALCMVLSLMPTGVLARGETTSGTCGANLTWTEVDGVLTISGSGPMEDYVDATVPWNDSITEVRLESGVTTIGDYAFWLCPDLKKVTIPEGVTSIGDSAFYYCSSLCFDEF